MVDFELLNTLISTCIGVCIFILLACFTYIVKSILQGCNYIDNVQRQSREVEIKSLVKDVLKNKDKDGK